MGRIAAIAALCSFVLIQFVYAAVLDGLDPLDHSRPYDQNQNHHSDPASSHHEHKDDQNTLHN